jgi:hypothetical protein
MNDENPAALLAPCGVNCSACYVHLKTKNPCAGCRVHSVGQPAHCRTCKIKTCAAEQPVDFCADCPKFPCTLIKRMDKSYQQRYHVSLIANGLRLKAIGIEAYQAEENARWTCKVCGGVISQHDGFCSACGAAK